MVCSYLHPQNKKRIVALKLFTNITLLVKDLMHNPPAYKAAITLSWRPTKVSVIFSRGLDRSLWSYFSSPSCLLLFLLSHLLCTPSYVNLNIFKENSSQLQVVDISIEFHIKWSGCKPNIFSVLHWLHISQHVFIANLWSRKLLLLSLVATVTN